MAIFVNGEAVKIPYEQLIEEGKRIMAEENIPPSKIFDPDAYAASVAVARYDQAHREWVEAQQQAQAASSA
jgi:hypothetical protein